MEKFAVGVIVGMLGGALLVANNYKMRTLVKKGQAEIGAKLDKLMDEKIDELTREVREHNNFARRVPVIEEQVKVINHRIDDLKKVKP